MSENRLELRVNFLQGFSNEKTHRESISLENSTKNRKAWAIEPVYREELGNTLSAWEIETSAIIAWVVNEDDNWRISEIGTDSSDFLELSSTDDNHIFNSMDALTVSKSQLGKHIPQKEFKLENDTKFPKMWAILKEGDRVITREIIARIINENGRWYLTNTHKRKGSTSGFWVKTRNKSSLDIENLYFFKGNDYILMVNHLFCFTSNEHHDLDL